MEIEVEVQKWIILTRNENGISEELGYFYCSRSFEKNNELNQLTEVLRKIYPFSQKTQEF